MATDITPENEQANSGQLIPDDAVFAQLEARAQEIEQGARKEQ